MRKIAINRLKWQSRRGMLELDLVLDKFIDNYYDDLTNKLTQQYVLLMQFSDYDIYNWITNCDKNIIIDSSVYEIIKFIRQKQ